MNYDTSRLAALEARYERLLLLIGDMQAAIGRLQQLANDLANSQQKSGGATVYSMAGQVIGAGSSATGVTVTAMYAGSTYTVSSSAKVYNQMQSATVASKTIMLGLNPDGTYSAISQSC
jgi:hypothetical protein